MKYKIHSFELAKPNHLMEYVADVSIYKRRWWIFGPWQEERRRFRGDITGWICLETGYFIHDLYNSSLENALNARWHLATLIKE